MTLLYRAIWNDDRPEILDSAGDQFQSWLSSKSIDIRLPDEGHERVESRMGPAEVTVRRAIAGPRSALQIELDEDRDSGERWSTRLVALDDREGENWLWIDLTRVASNAVQRPDLIAPRLARELIESGSDARVDQVRLTTKSQSIKPGGLAGLIRNVDRSLPIVVFTESFIEGITPTIRRADSTAKRLAGAVQVMRLDNSDVDEFRELIGPELAVWGGAARIYLPNVGRDGLRSERHRYISRAQMGDGIDRAGSIVANMLTGTITARREPPAYEHVRRELKLGRDRSDQELLALAWAEIELLTRERNDLKSELEATNDDLLDVQADFEEAARESARLSATLRTIFRSNSSGSDAPEEVDLDVTVDSIEEAILHASELLSNLVIHRDAPRDIDSLDSHPSGRAWGLGTWRGLRALHLYASQNFEGDFRRWCETSGDQWSWPHTDKHLAMRESESVESNARLRAQRIFPVDPEVDPSGKILMWAHLKIAQGGGPLAPRVYFLDDTRGPTGKIHVGFIGPHKYTENTKTN